MQACYKQFAKLAIFCTYVNLGFFCARIMLDLPWKETSRILKSHLRPTRKVFVYKIQVNPIHTILKYCDYYDFMDR